MDSFKAAILGGADAVYCGLNRFNARNRASNLSLEDLPGAVRLAHIHKCKVFLTLNILITESEIPSFIALLKRLIPANIDGVILQDLGMLYLLSEYFSELPIHASTQLTTHNEGQIHFLKAFKASRVNLSRELNLHEIETLAAFGKQNRISTEVFVHGSQCLSFSGLCYFSSALSGNSGNRGRCSQPCRDRYIKTPEGKDYPLNLKDHSAFFDLPDLIEAGVDSLKIEGRIKKFDYIYTVVKAWKEQIRSFEEHQVIQRDNSELYKVFNRDFSNSFLRGEIHRDNFIDNPRDHSLSHHLKSKAPGTDLLKEANTLREAAALTFYREKEEKRARIRKMIQKLSVAKTPVRMWLKGQEGLALELRVNSAGRSFALLSGEKLTRSGSRILSESLILSKFKALEDTAYFIQEVDLSGLQGELYLPMGALSALRKEVIRFLNESQRSTRVPEPVPPGKAIWDETAPELSVLLDDPGHLDSLKHVDVQLYFQLPSHIGTRFPELMTLFRSHPNLVPWFPPVLIGEDYQGALKFLSELKPSCLVTNNTGIAQEAFRLGMPWIAGPHLNLVNSYSLLGLKRKFNCSAAFISSELSKNQIKSIRSPGDFKLHYSIYHPMVLMTSRQCLFHQVSACDKIRMDKSCLSGCDKKASITNLKGEELLLEKTRGNYHTMYHQEHYLNTDIMEDLPGMFSGFQIDLREVGASKPGADRASLVQGFLDLIHGIPDAKRNLNRALGPTRRTSYLKGI